MSDVTVSDIVRFHTSVKGSAKPLSSRQQEFEIPGNRNRLEIFGFKLTEGGAHTSRTMMLKEITRLLASSDPEAMTEDYRRLIVVENVLGKATETTRQETARRLRELYSLSTKFPIFSVYRQLMRFDSQSAQLLSLLIAWARDPLFRATTAAVMRAPIGEKLTGDDFKQAIMDVFPHQYSATIIGNIARHAASSWTQSGHLTGRTKKIRSRVDPRPSAVTFALIMGHGCGVAGAQLFTSVWCRLLDLNSSEARSLAEQAHRQELITLRAVGPVVEISFPRFRQFLKGFS